MLLKNNTTRCVRIWNDSVSCHPTFMSFRGHSIDLRFAKKECTLGFQFFTSVDASMVFMQERHSKGGGIHDNTTLTTKLLPIHCIIFRSSKETVYFREISERSLPQLHTVVSRFSGLCLSPPKGSLNHYSSLIRSDHCRSGS